MTATALDPACFIRQWGSSTWYAIGDKISGGFPEANNEDGADLLQFSLKFTDPENSSGELIIPACGDDIAICDSSDKLSILGGACVGKILRLEKDIKGWTNWTPDGRPVIEYGMTIEQRNFSKYPFDIINESSASLSSILDTIFLTHTTGLGGILANGVIIPRYYLYSTDLTIPNFQFNGTAKEMLQQLLNTISYKWKIYNFCEPNSTNTINVIKQVQIWLA